jgi:murein DD-endopeptidase MepM/ murein hydrolase activator NlpD
MYKKIIIMITLVFNIYNSSDLFAEQDFQKEYEFYQELCSSRTSFNLNAEVCNEFNLFIQSDFKVMEMVASTEQYDLDLKRLVELIRNNEALIEERQASLKQDRRKQRQTRRRIRDLENAVSASLAFMQDSSPENYIVDFIMGSRSFDDLLIGIDGINAVTMANEYTMQELNQLASDLEESVINLERDLARLEETKVKQERLLLEFQRREIELYANARVTSNSPRLALNGIDFSSFFDESFRLPTNHGMVSASTWYYAGGGWHPGLDIALPVNSPLVAPASGVVLTRASGFGGYGNFLVTAHRVGDFVYTILFAHLNSFIQIENFDKGETIAFTGNTGFSTGPHVHIEVIRHNTNDLEKVVEQFQRTGDHWFGLGYTGVGDCLTVCRLKPAQVFNLSVGQRY